MASAVIASAMLGGAVHAADVRLLAGVGFTAGGDTLVDVTYSNGNHATVKGGGQIAFHGGVELKFNDVLSTQLLAGYHFDRASASNGSATFSRVPVELLGHVRVSDWVRLGGGGRYSTNARLEASGFIANSVPDTRLTTNGGTVAELEILPYRGIAIKLRYVSERFKFSNNYFPTSRTIDGSHGGVYVNYYFL
ncbi:MAG: hypothetical protein ABW190_11075 [Rhizobacter sp.]